MCEHLDLIHRQAPGRWLDILSGLAPDLRPAVEKRGRHVPCPVHGGKDGFRLFRDADQTGGGICNTVSGWASPSIPRLKRPVFLWLPV